MLKQFKNINITSFIIGVTLFMCLFISAHLAEKYILPIDLSYQTPLSKYILLFLEQPSNKYWKFFFTILLWLIQIIMVIRLDLKYSISNKRTLLSGLFYTLLTLFYLPAISLQTILIANIFIMLALNKILGTYKKEIAFTNIFDAAYLIFIAAVFYYPAIFILVILFVGIILIRPLIWREWLLVIIGLLAATVLYIMIFYLISDNFSEIYLSFFNYFKINRIKHSLNLAHLFTVCYTVFLIAISSLRMIKVYPTLNVNLRMYLQLFLYYFILILILFYSIAQTSFELLIFGAVPVSYILSNVFVYAKSKWFRFLFFLFVILIIFNHIFYYLNF